MNDELIWEDTISIGIEEIDLQHKEIINAVNNLYNAIKEKKSKKRIIKLIEKLDYYVEFHFKTEEHYMKLYDYEGLFEHKKAHKFFKEAYDQIRCNYFYVDNKNLPRDNVLNVYALLLAQTFKSWLIFHLQTHDKDFGVFLSEKSNKKND